MIISGKRDSNGELGEVTFSDLDISQEAFFSTLVGLFTGETRFRIFIKIDGVNEILEAKFTPMNLSEENPGS